MLLNCYDCYLESIICFADGGLSGHRGDTSVDQRLRKAGGARGKSHHLFAIQAAFLQVLRLLLGACPLCHHGNRWGVLRQEEAELGGLQQGSGVGSSSLLCPILSFLRGEAVRRVQGVVSAEVRLGGAGLGWRRGQSWCWGRQWALVAAAGGLKYLWLRTSERTSDEQRQTDACDDPIWLAALGMKQA